MASATASAMAPTVVVAVLSAMAASVRSTDVAGAEAIR
jgi:hypothetical protein